jgi:hypothetical protein
MLVDARTLQINFVCRPELSGGRDTATGAAGRARFAVPVRPRLRRYCPNRPAYGREAHLP